MERFSAETVATDGKCLLLSLGILLENDQYHQYDVLEERICIVHVQTMARKGSVHLLHFKLFRMMCGCVFIYENVIKIQRKTGVRGGKVEKKLLMKFKKCLPVFILYLRAKSLNIRPTQASY
jgi:hypothetical protein